MVRLESDLYREEIALRATLQISQCYRSPAALSAGDTIAVHYPRQRTLTRHRFRHKGKRMTFWRNGEIGPSPLPLLPESGSLELFLEPEGEHYTPAAGGWSFDPIRPLDSVTN